MPSEGSELCSAAHTVLVNYSSMVFSPFSRSCAHRKVTFLNTAMRQRRRGDPCQEPRPAPPHKASSRLLSAALLSCCWELKHELLTQQVWHTNTHRVHAPLLRPAPKNNKQWTSRRARVHVHRNDDTHANAHSQSGVDGKKQ